MRAPRAIGITGSPGTGKKTVGRLLADRLGYQYVNINNLALKQGAVSARDRWGYVVDLTKLRRLSKAAISRGKVVVVGHLLPSVYGKKDLDLVIILRCHPAELLERYENRCYEPEKAKRNALAEAIDEIMVEAVRRFGKQKTAELDTTGKRAPAVVKEIMDVIEGQAKPRIGIVDWLYELEGRGTTFLLS